MEPPDMPGRFRQPFGPRLDPDAATARPTPGSHGKKKGQPARPHGLTGPTPSGMTCFFLVGVAGFEPTASSSRTWLEPRRDLPGQTTAHVKPEEGEGPRRSRWP